MLAVQSASGDRLGIQELKELSDEVTYVPPRPVPIHRLQMPLELIVMPEILVERPDRLLHPNVVHRERDIEDIRDEVRRRG